MKIIMNTTCIVSIDEIEKFLQGTDKIKFSVNSKKEKYWFISETLIKFKYLKARKKDKTLVKMYLKKVTGYSKKQLKRLIGRWKKEGLLEKTFYRNKFPCKYGPREIELLAKADEALNFPNGHSLKRNLVREFKMFSKKDYAIISQISVSHIYNIRNNSSQYQSKTMHYTKTNPATVPIGERRKPYPEGKPGYLRVDSVHQGDFNGVKGVYHINVVDEVTQWELVGCVEVISDRFLLPLLEKLILQFPFRVVNFHSDNGSEYINYQVAGMLNRLIVKQTKSRSRRTNDQALVEGKNVIIRKHLGRNHIPKKYAGLINSFYQNYFNIYLNFHRVCSFSTDQVDKKGKIRKKYDTHLTPYEKLKSLKNAKDYLKENVSFEELDKIAYAESDIEFGVRMNKEKERILKR